MKKAFAKEHCMNISIAKTGKPNNHRKDCSCPFCCRKDGIYNPFYGNHHSEKTKNTISKKNTGKVGPFKGMKRPEVSGDNNGAKRPSVRRLISNRVKETHWDSSGKKNPNFGKGCQSKNNSYKGGYYRNTWFRSSWEIKYAKWLDSNGLKWKYECKVFDLGDCTYRPDFYLPETDKYIEIKGYATPEFKRKFSLFKNQYPNINIKILLGRDLMQLNVL